MTSSKLSPLKTSGLILAAAVLMTGPLTSIAVAHGHHHRHGVRIFVAGPGFYGYGGSCHWLRLRALETGSPYWWQRYRFCLYG